MQAASHITSAPTCQKLQGFQIVLFSYLRELMQSSFIYTTMHTISQKGVDKCLLFVSCKRRLAATSAYCARMGGTYPALRNHCSE
jgi:hypothetical protein